MSADKDKPFTYDTYDISLPKRNDLRNFCHVLTSKGCLKHTQLDTGFSIEPSLKPEQKVFVSGGWAEEVTLYCIDKTLKAFTNEHPVKYKLFWNTKLKRIDPVSTEDVDMEFDLVVKVADRFYIFEIKSGSDLLLDKWVERTHLFDDGKNRFITCTADESLSPRLFKPFKRFSMSKLEARFTKMLEKDFLKPSPAS